MLFAIRYFRYFRYFDGGNAFIDIVSLNKTHSQE